jgi:hypothetical protein
VEFEEACGVSKETWARAGDESARKAAAASAPPERDGVMGNLLGNVLGFG